jgi:putative transcriptional regulator
LFVGYAGWGAGQLEAELEAGDWTVTAATSALVFGDCDTVWQRAKTNVADRRLAAALRIKHVPGQPWHN